MFKTFTTGAQRSSDADGARLDLLPVEGLFRAGEAAASGAAKYGEFNWQKGMPLSEFLNHLLQHIYKYQNGDRSEDHLGHAAWNALAACHAEKQGWTKESLAHAHSFTTAAAPAPPGAYCPMPMMPQPSAIPPVHENGGPSPGYAHQFEAALKEQGGVNFGEEELICDWGIIDVQHDGNHFVTTLAIEIGENTAYLTLTSFAPVNRTQAEKVVRNYIARVKNQS